MVSTFWLSHAWVGAAESVRAVCECGDVHADVTHVWRAAADTPGFRILASNRRGRRPWRAAERRMACHMRRGHRPNGCNLLVILVFLKLEGVVWGLGKAAAAMAFHALSTTGAASPRRAAVRWRRVHWCAAGCTASGPNQRLAPLGGKGGFRACGDGVLPFKTRSAGPIGAPATFLHPLALLNESDSCEQGSNYQPMFESASRTDA